MDHSGNKNRDKELASVDQLIRSKEFLISVSLAIITTIGGFVFALNSEQDTVAIVLQSLLVSILELVLGTSVWAVTSVSRQMRHFQENLSNQLSGFRKELEVYNTMLGHLGQIQDPIMLESLTKITANFIAVHKHPLLFEIMKKELRGIAQQFSEMSTTNTYTVWAQAKGSSVQRIFHNYMEALPENYRYDTVSNLDFWSTGTLARPIDFLDANEEMAKKRGVVIRRVFLIEDDYKLTQNQLILLEKHAEASNDGNIETRVRSLNIKNEKRSQYGNYALCTPPNSKNPSLLLEMYHTKRRDRNPRLFERMEIVVEPDRIERHRRRFNRLFSEGQDVLDFLSKQEQSSAPELPPHA